MKKIAKKIFIKYLQGPLSWWREFGFPNITNFKKVIRGVQWAFGSGYTQYPPFVVIDPVVKCNLNCPLCSIPPQILPHEGTKLSKKDFGEILHKIKRVTNKVLFCHAGEPFLNLELFTMIEMVNDKQMMSMVGTNGTMLHRENREKIFESGLDSLQISFDGFSKQTYEKYRVGANFDRVLGMITALAKEKKKRKSWKPYITVTYLVNAYNAHEVEAAREYFEGLGVQFVAKGINLNLHRRDDDKETPDLSHWVETDSPYSIYRRNDRGEVEYKVPYKPICNTCEKPVINCKGDILLCCHDIFNTVKLGNIYELDFEQFWSSDEYQKIRELAAHRKLPLCKICGK